MTQKRKLICGVFRPKNLRVGHLGSSGTLAHIPNPCSGEQYLGERHPISFPPRFLIHVRGQGLRNIACFICVPKFHQCRDRQSADIAIEVNFVWVGTGWGLSKTRLWTAPFTRVFSRRGSVEESGAVGPPRVWPGQARRGRLSAAV